MVTEMMPIRTRHDKSKVLSIKGFNDNSASNLKSIPAQWFRGAKTDRSDKSNRKYKQETFHNTAFYKNKQLLYYINTTILKMRLSGAPNGKNIVPLGTGRDCRLLRPCSS